MVGSRLVAGVDSSTQTTKALLPDTDDGTVVAGVAAAHAVTGSRGARESDPAQWWDALATALGRAPEEAKSASPGAQVTAISVVTQQRGLVDPRSPR